MIRSSWLDWKLLIGFSQFALGSGWVAQGLPLWNFSPLVGWNTTLFLWVVGLKSGLEGYALDLLWCGLFPNRKSDFLEFLYFSLGQGLWPSLCKSLTLRLIFRMMRSNQGPGLAPFDFCSFLAVFQVGRIVPTFLDFFFRGWPLLSRKPCQL